MDPRLERSRRKAKLKRSDLSPNRRSLGGRYDTEPAPHHLDQQDRGGFEGTGAGGEKATPYRNLGDLSADPSVGHTSGKGILSEAEGDPPVSDIENNHRDPALHSPETSGGIDFHVEESRNRDMESTSDGPAERVPELYSPGVREAECPPEVNEASDISNECGHRELQGLYLMMVEMLRNSATQTEGIQQLLSEFLQSPQAGEEPGSQQRTRTRRPQERQRRAELDLRLKADVRQHALLMLGRVDNSSQIPPPPDPRAIDEFNTNKTGGPSKRLGQLRLDLDGPVRSPWNVRAARCFRKSFNKSQLYHEWQNSLVEEAFLRHIETIRTNYCKQIGRVPASITLERQIRSARRSRVKTLIQNRVYICDIVPGISRFKTYVNRLADGGGMSGDETDRHGKEPIRGQRKFLVIRPGWRSQEVTDWLRVIDDLYTVHRFSHDGRASRGNWVRQRIDSGRVDWDRFPVSGLPENFYDPVWLCGLSQAERDRLAVQPKASLEHSTEVLDAVSHYSQLHRERG